MNPRSVAGPVASPPPGLERSPRVRRPRSRHRRRALACRRGRGPDTTVSSPRRRPAVLGALLVAVALVLLLTPVPALLGALDRAWLAAMTRSEWGPATLAARRLDRIGSTLGTVTIGAAVALWLALRHDRRGLWIWVLGVTGAELLTFAVKLVVARPRPPTGLVATFGASFPSGHTAAAAAMVTALVLVLTDPVGSRRRLAGALGTPYVVLMAWSRTYLRVHWLSDVLAGAVLGAATVVVVARLAAAARVATPRPPQGAPPRGGPPPGGPAR